MFEGNKQKELYEIESHLSNVKGLWERVERSLAVYYGEAVSDVLPKLRLALAEAIVNGIEHAHQEDGRPLKLELKLSESEASFSITDTGPGFEWPSKCEGPPAWDSEGGRGLFLIRSLMDDVQYVSGDEQNVLTLQKTIPRTERVVQQKKPDSARTILLADDDPQVRLLLSGLIERIGCKVIAVSSGDEALEILCQNVALDAILLDVVMPGRSGLDVLREYKARKQVAFVPVVLVTGRDDPFEVAEGFNAGADEYLIKPPRAQELWARIRAAFRLKDMATDLRSTLDDIEGQLREGRRLQNSVLPAPELSFGRVRFSSVFRPCNYVGGDMVGYFRLDAKRVGFYIADVAGHGLAAAMFSIWVNRSLLPIKDFDGIVKRKTVERPYYEIVRPGQVCSAIDMLMSGNDGLSGDDGERFLTIFYATLDTSTGELDYCCAGHPAPIILRANGEVSRLKANSPPVGLGFGFTFDTESTTLSPGERLIVFSDCAIEAMSPDREEFGEERLMSTVENTRTETPDDQLRSLLSALHTHREVPSLEDDLTLLSAQFE